LIGGIAGGRDAACQIGDQWAVGADAGHVQRAAAAKVGRDAGAGTGWQPRNAVQKMSALADGRVHGRVETGCPTYLTAYVSAARAKTASTRERIVREL